ncbi:MAG: gluconate 2-dehydrogenase subunit 3 family protein [Chloroflexi bacterium]|nr:gluconate 2-dehydrogenase subunit 3 family protein [Chloroflexota bacterium]
MDAGDVRRFFPEEEWDLVEALAARILPQPDRPLADRIRVVGLIDEMLHRDETDGFRKPDVPWHEELWRTGLAGVEQASRAQYGEAFEHLQPEEQDGVLAAIQAGHAAGDALMPAPSTKRHAPVDAVVVGVGAAGGVLVKELAEAGWSVVGLEAGPFWDSQRDFVCTSSTGVTGASPRATIRSGWPAT